MNNYKIFAVDFDGTLCENNYPEIGQPIPTVINFVKRMKSEGHKIILWTCREDTRLSEAVEWCKNQGIKFDAVNSNLPEQNELYGNDPRKIGADYYIDDKSMTLDDVFVNECYANRGAGK